MLRSWADAKLIPAQTSSNHKARGPRSLRVCSSRFGFAFLLGVCVGYVLAPAAQACSLFAPLNYLRAVKLIAWDFRQVSHMLESWSGLPILTSSSGHIYLGFVGLCGVSCSVFGLQAESDLLSLFQALLARSRRTPHPVTDALRA